MVGYICDTFQNLSVILFNFFNLFHICVFVYLFLIVEAIPSLKVP